MNASGSLVLAVSAVVSSPLAMLVVDGAVSLETALFRAGLVFAGCWVLLSLAAAMLSMSAAPATPTGPSPSSATGEPPTPATSPAPAASTPPMG